MRYSTWLILSALLLSNGCSTLAFKQGSATETSGISTVSIRPVGAIVQTGLGCLKNVEELRKQTAGRHNRQVKIKRSRAVSQRFSAGVEVAGPIPHT